MEIICSTCGRIYPELGAKNTGTILRIIKSLRQQGVNPTISALAKNCIDLQFEMKYPDDFGYAASVTQTYDFGENLFSQHTTVSNPDNNNSVSIGERFDKIPMRKMDL